jgi:CheY-like chemotaxis protein
MSERPPRIAHDNSEAGGLKTAPSKHHLSRTAPCPLKRPRPSKSTTPASRVTAAAALAAIDSGTRVDIVVTDIEMPDMDGFELTAALRQNPGTAGVPVIALSAMVSNEAIERGRRVGFHDFVAKFDRTGLIAAIKEQSDDLHQAA